MTMAVNLAGKRILVVEDEYFIASDIKRALVKAEATVVGPVGHLGEGLALLGGEPLDGAILDVNLEGATSYPIADKLAERDVPYLFLTGYDGWSLPERYRAAPRIAKPFQIGAVLKTIEGLMTKEPAA